MAHLRPPVEGADEMTPAEKRFLGRHDLFVREDVIMVLKLENKYRYANFPTEENRQEWIRIITAHMGCDGS